MSKILKYLIFSLFLAVLPGVLFSQSTPVNEEALELFMQGKTFELQDNYIKAIELYKKALKKEDAPGIYYTISKLYHYTSRYQESLEYALLAMKKDPSNVNYKEHAADVYIMLNDYPKALALLKDIMNVKPNDINVLYNIGRLYEISRQPSEAIKIYEKITEDFLYDEIVLMRMITIYENYRDYLNAASAMEKLLTLDPANTELKYRIAATYVSVKQFDDAIRIYENILSTNSKDQDAQREIIKIYFHTNRAAEAFERYGQLINKDTVDFDTKMSVAMAFYQVGMQDTAMIITARSVMENLKNEYPGHWMPEFYLALMDMVSSKQQPDDNFFNSILAKADTSAEAYVQIGFIYLDQNNFNKALNVFEPGAKKFTEDFRLNYLTGLTYYRLGQNRESLPYLEKALYIEPRDLNVLSTLGIVYDNLQMDAECEKVYEQAIQYYPDNILLLNNYAYHLSERSKKLKEALEMSKRTIEMEPDNSSYLDTYGWILFKMGDFKNAVVYIERAVKLGANAELLLHLGEVYEAMDDIPKAVKYWRQGAEMDPTRQDLKDKLLKYQ
jgi:tetratricopeptide (TPR) repeat protein